MVMIYQRTSLRSLNVGLGIVVSVGETTPQLDVDTQQNMGVAKWELGRKRAKDGKAWRGDGHRERIEGRRVLSCELSTSLVSWLGLRLLLHAHCSWFVNEFIFTRECHVWPALKKYLKSSVASDGCWCDVNAIRRLNLLTNVYLTGNVMQLQNLKWVHTNLCNIMCKSNVLNNWRTIPASVLSKVWCVFRHGRSEKDKTRAGWKQWCTWSELGSELEERPCWRCELRISQNGTCPDHKGEATSSNVLL